mgnify:CR=1 FL=1
MALDHARDYFSNARFDPLDLAHTTPTLFFTRWITHFCAPVALSSWRARGRFSRAPGGGRNGSSPRFLWTRGLWLVVVEVTIVSFGWSFDFGLHDIALQVIWAIGWSMVVLAVLVHLPTAADRRDRARDHRPAQSSRSDPPGRFGSFDWLWKIVHVQSWTPIASPGGHRFMLVYPLVPWIGVMAAGYAFGSVFTWEAARRKRFPAFCGSGLVLLFVVLRWSNAYGDPHPWTVQKNGLYTFLSFVNCEKYPPSLLYLLMTLGPAILLLALLERPAGPDGVQGVRVRPGAVLLLRAPHPPHPRDGRRGFYAKYGPAVFGYGMNNPPPPDFGFGLPLVYLFWAIAVVTSPALLWFAGLKARRRDVWLSYL